MSGRTVGMPVAKGLFALGWSGFALGLRRQLGVDWLKVDWEYLRL